MSIASHPRTPGSVLSAEFLHPMGLTAEFLAAETGLPVALIAGVVAGKVRVDEEIAACLGDFLGTESWFWLELQSTADRGLLTA